MTRKRGVLRAWLLAAALSSTITAAAAMSVPPHLLFARDDTCGDASYSKCPQAGLPSNFCCKPGTSCISLAGNTTILCCPEGDDCSTIAAIVCDVQLQNATSAPDAVVKTTALTSKLPTARSPPARDASSTSSASGTTAASTGHASTAAPTASATSSTGAGASTTGGGSGSDEEGDPAKAHAEGASVSAIVGGVVGGVSLVALAVLGIWIYLFRRRKDNERRRASDQSFVSKNARGMISNPIPQDGFTYGRTDFISKSNSTRSTAASRPHPGQDPAFSAAAKSYRDSYQSNYSSASSPGDHNGTQFDERSYHPSAIISSLKVESEAEEKAAAKKGNNNLGRVSEDQGNFETIDISFNDALAVPDFDVNRHSRETTTSRMTQWPGANPSSAPGGRR
ncbi:hypothetical protein KJ359_011535 [Pestalotiopsis sp. 9143b]|nr:hypothetical protein KJ359_011535 [Pestalotiopsis sp. 9143b]